MKKFFLFAAACVALVACKNDENVLNNAPQGTPFEAGQYVTISAGMPTNGNQSAARKISGTGGATEISYLWEENDKILVKVGADTAHFVLVDGAGTNSATFAGKMPGSGSTFDIQYPIDAPDLSEQAYKENGLPAGMMSFGATGCSIDAASELTATTSALKLNLTGAEEISKIVINMVDAGNKEYTLTTDDVTLSSTATPFYLVVNPVTSKVRVTVYAASTAPIDCFTSASITFVANQCADTQDKEAKLADYICFTALADGSSVGFNDEWVSMAQYMISVSLEWRKNDDEWNTVSLSPMLEPQSLSQGDKLYIRASSSNTAMSSDMFGAVFSITGNVKVSGNIMALLNKTPGSANLSEKCFKSLFSNQSSISDASELLLPATTLTSGCYSNMFQGCTNLTKAPTLPATTLSESCYYFMFEGCSSLVNAPALPATALAKYCYCNMFWGCSSLSSAPALPASTLFTSCYSSMFRECTTLVDAPDLPATTMASQCYNAMFCGCTNLVNVPSIAATTLSSSCFNAMFENCSNLEVAPTLLADKLEGASYSKMFKGCSKLKSVTMLATDLSGYGCLGSWLEGAGTSATSPTVYVANSTAKTAIEAWTYGTADTPAIPDNWTVEVKP